MPVRKWKEVQEMLRQLKGGDRLITDYSEEIHEIKKKVEQIKDYL